MDEIPFNPLGIAYHVTIGPIMRGLYLLLRGPRSLFRLLYRQETAVWPIFGATLLSILIDAILIFELITGSYMQMFWTALLNSWFIGLLYQLGLFCEGLGGIFAWYPGIGYKDVDGAFRDEQARSKNGKGSTGGYVLRGSLVRKDPSQKKSLLP